MVGNEIEMEIGPGARRGEYAVRVIHAAGGGEPAGLLQLDVDDLLERRPGLEHAVLASAARSRGGIVAEIEQPLREIGLELFEALFGGPVAGVYRASLAVARDRGQKLRVVLRLTAPELSVLPWESLFDPELDAYLCRKEPLVRHVPAPYTPEPLEVEPPLRILGLVASPRGLDPLDVEAERSNLEAALAAPLARQQVMLEWLAEASWDTVHDRLLTGRWHVLHFIGHGDYDPDRDEGTLVLLGPDGRPDYVDASRLADLLDEADPTPRLVVLNSCSSGQGGTEELFTGTAATLVRGGISAVAAMQFTVSDRAAVAFARGFYTALAGGRRVDEAVRSGRIAMLGVPHTLEWVTPVLYLRGDAANLFKLTVTDSPALQGAATPLDARDSAETMRPEAGSSDEPLKPELSAPTASAPEPSTTQTQATTAPPVVVEKIWCLPSRPEGKFREVIARHTGRLEIGPDSAMFTSKTLKVVLSDIQSVEFFELKGHPWTHVAYVDSGTTANAYFCDGGNLGWRGMLGGTKRIYTALKELEHR